VKLQSAQEALAEALATVGRVVPGKSTLPVLTNVLLEADPGEKTTARKAILRFRDGEWIAAYIEQGEKADAESVAIKIRLTERQRVIPALAASAALLETQYVDMWAPTSPTVQPQRRRSDILEAAARQGRDLGKLANEFRDRLALMPQPTLLVSGQEDRIMDPRDAETAAHLLAQGRFLAGWPHPQDQQRL